MVVDGINEILRLLFLQVKNKLDTRYGCFEVFCIDFLLRDDMSPMIMDISSNPYYGTEMEDSREFLRLLLRDVITMACDLHEKQPE